MNVVARIKEIESEMMGLLMAAGGDELGPQVLLAPFADDFDELLGRFPEEYEEMRLDEVVVGAIAPIVSSFLLARELLLTSLAGSSPLPKLGPPLLAALFRARAQALAETLPHRQRRRQDGRDGRGRLWRSEPLERWEQQESVRPRDDSVRNDDVDRLAPSCALCHQVRPFIAFEAGTN